MNTTEIGRKAEKAARVYLEMRGYQILEQNWRLPRHEIDIIAKKSATIYFVEVRYRKNDLQGGGYESLTASKLKKMHSAAWAWVDENNYTGQYTLAAVEVSGKEFAVLGVTDNIY